MLNLASIESALGRIRKSIHVSPCTRSETFSDLTGNSVYLKLEEPTENRRLQRTGRTKQAA